MQSCSVRHEVGRIAYILEYLDQQILLLYTLMSAEGIWIAILAPQLMRTMGPIYSSPENKLQATRARKVRVPVVGIA